MEQEPQSNQRNWETAKSLGGIALFSGIFLGGGVATAENLSRGTPDGAISSVVTLAVTCLGAYGIHIERERL